MSLLFALLLYNRLVDIIESAQESRCDICWEMNMANLIRVLLIDDDVEMQEIVETILGLTTDIALIGKGGNGRDALALCAQLQPDVLLLDVLMPIMDGVEAASLLHAQFRDINILVMSSLQDHENVRAMLQNGADGYINKSKLFHSLAEAVRATYYGKRVFSKEAFSHLSASFGKPANKDFSLSDREREVLTFMAAGLSKPEIAAKLGIHQSTVKFHIENICAKIGVRTRSEALIVAAKNNLV